MRIRCRREDVLAGLQVIAPSVPKRHVNDLLDNRIIFRAGRQPTLSGTDYNVYVTYRLPEDSVTIEVEGELLLPLDKLSQLLKDCPDEAVVLELRGENRCRVISSDGYLELPACGSDSYPSAPVVSGVAGVEIETGDFVRSVERGRVAVATEEGRYLFNHVLLEIEKDALAVVTTDGRRMARGTALLRNPQGWNGKLVLPLSVLHQVKRLSERSAGGIRISSEKAKVCFETERGAVYASTRDEKSFPDYRPHLFRKGRTKRVTVARRDILSAMRRLVVLSTEQARSVRVAFAGDRLTISARGSAVGDGQLEIAAVGELRDFELHLDPQYVIDGLQAMDQERLTLHIEDECQGVLFADRDDCQYLVMPIVVEDTKEPPVVKE